MCQLWALHVVTKRQFFYIYLLYKWWTWQGSVQSPAVLSIQERLQILVAQKYVSHQYRMSASDLIGKNGTCQGEVCGLKTDFQGRSAELYDQ